MYDSYAASRAVCRRTLSLLASTMPTLVAEHLTEAEFMRLRDISPYHATLPKAAAAVQDAVPPPAAATPPRAHERGSLRELKARVAASLQQRPLLLLEFRADGAISQLGLVTPRNLFRWGQGVMVVGDYIV